MNETPLLRETEIRDFLKAAGWGGAALSPLPGDASTRRYIRVSRADNSAMLMDHPMGAEAPTAGPNASPEERMALGYNAVARLAGADCARFVAVADYLRARGLAAPEIFAADTRNGLLLLEDLGDDLYADVLAKGGDAEALYGAAIDALAALHEEDAPAALGTLPLFAYDETALLAETDLLTEWFLPHALGRATDAGLRDEHRALWREALKPLEFTRRVLVHRDYHAQNLLWLPQRTGVARVGLVDFQDAVAGHEAYDLISLLEDARRDVAPDLADAMMRRYLARRPGTGEGSFLGNAALLAAQRNAKIIGIFARLYRRDGKSRYLAHLPRVWGYMTHDLAHPSLVKLQTWYDRNVPQEARLRA
jgi:aminoglycoside/choline kinase family phosphotransferase